MPGASLEPTIPLLQNKRDRMNGSVEQFFVSLMFNDEVLLLFALCLTVCVYVLHSGLQCTLVQYSILHIGQKGEKYILTIASLPPTLSFHFFS